jgi:hypothetical protein
MRITHHFGPIFRTWPPREIPPKQGQNATVSFVFFVFTRLCAPAFRHFSASNFKESNLQRIHYSTKLNLHDGATKGRNHYLLHKKITRHQTWIEPESYSKSCNKGTLGFDIPDLFE